jgi:hypothetical protein
MLTGCGFARGHLNALGNALGRVATMPSRLCRAIEAALLLAGFEPTPAGACPGSRTRQSPARLCRARVNCCQADSEVEGARRTKHEGREAMKDMKGGQGTLSWLPGFAGLGL